MKSLLIVSVPRSASTALERACVKGLGPLKFQNCGEILNAGRNEKLKVPQYAKRDKQFEKLKNQCIEHSKMKIIRDVVQPHFITQHIDWLTQLLNIIFLLRPVPEIMVSRKRLGWKMPKKTVRRYQDMLRNIPEQESYKYLNYYDFIRDDPNKLVEILQNWYPECPSFNYMDKEFINKRNRTFLSIRQAGIRPQKS